VEADVYMAVQTSTDNGANWNAPTGKVKIKGETGATGVATYTATVYKQIAGDPGSPSATASSYNFSNGILTPPAGWVVIQPSTTTVNTWACEYTFSGPPGSTVTGIGNWSATRIDAVAGAPGSNGVSINTVELYWQTTTPSPLPTGTSYDFSTDVVTGTLGSWSRTQPTATTTPTYMTTCTFTVTAPTTTQTRSVWTAAVVVAQNGAKGDTGGVGGTGPTGTRGSRTLYDVNATAGNTGYNSTTLYTYGANAAGLASYSAKATDLIATATSGSTPTTPIKGDTVNFSNGTTFVHTLTHTGSAWAAPGVVIDGNLLVTGSVTSTKIDTRNLDIKDGAGNVIFSSGVNLAASNITPSSAWINSNITVNADGSLGGAGAGKPTLAGLGVKTFRVMTNGMSSTTHPGTNGVYLDGSPTSAFTMGGFFTVIKILRSTGVASLVGTYAVFSGTANATAMATALNAITSLYVVVVVSFDEPQTNRLFGTLPAAMYRCGASRTVYGSPSFKYRSAYVLVGVAGCGEGNGAEFYQGSIDYDTSAWVDCAFSIANGTLTGISTAYTPNTLADFSYTGDLNATNGATFGTNISGQITAANASTFIAAAAIGTAQIGNAVITNAKIGTAEIDTLKITSGAISALISQSFSTDVRIGNFYSGLATYDFLSTTLVYTDASSTGVLIDFFAEVAPIVGQAERGACWLQVIYKVGGVVTTFGPTYGLYSADNSGYNNPTWSSFVRRNFPQLLVSPVNGSAYWGIRATTMGAGEMSIDIRNFEFIIQNARR
jgi:hypothetical protein